ncbi:rhodanese-like domain-containing protein [Rhodobacter sp. 24-YEA-8]|uniref:rhodanese-like domain-containing protein n=1 Tax=Rhodobacter sp. 24-YEA-8 TaxID=1884310 RepID=UPI000899F69F|nr:rhodanese-like domain-containing protein [Rhodobacter sp. 24-YEA-8]SEB46570.1 Rhodanese-related sulfurtransferase [Rhodobacter sp. 24-YEA-8]
MAEDRLTPEALATDPDRYVLIDVRGAEEYAAGHVDGALHIPLADLTARLAEIPTSRSVVTVWGKGGGRSAEGAAILRDSGRSDARWLEGGANGWSSRKDQTD